MPYGLRHKGRPPVEGSDQHLSVQLWQGEDPALIVVRSRTTPYRPFNFLPLHWRGIIFSFPTLPTLVHHTITDTPFFQLKSVLNSQLSPIYLLNQVKN